MHHKLLLNTVHHRLCGTVVTGGLISSLSCGQHALSEHLPKEHEGVQPQQLACAGLFIPSQEKKRCVADFVCIFLPPPHTCQKTTKQQSSHQVWKGAGRERREILCQTLWEPTPQQCAKGTKSVLMKTFLQHFSIKVQSVPFSSAC